MTADSVKPLTDSDNNLAKHSEDTQRLMQDSESLNTTLAGKGLLYRNKTCVNYLNQLAQKLTPDFHNENININVYIVKNATPNAMALPNGDIYIFSGLFATVQNESQLAAVLGHEIGHVIHQHGLKSAIERRGTIVAAHIADVILFGTSLSYVAAGASLASFSRDQEREADRVSLYYLQDAQFDLSQSPKVFELFSSLPDSRSISGSIYSSHPDNQERIEYLNSLIQSEFHQASIPPSPSNEFESVKAELFELNVKLRLRAKQYQMTLDLLEEADQYYSEKTLITFYRAEAFRLMAQNPDLAAQEHAWLEDRKLTDEDTNLFNQKVDENWVSAKDLYLNILNATNAPVTVHRGLALAYLHEGDNDQAKMHLQAYIAADAIKDRLYYKNLLNNLD